MDSITSNLFCATVGCYNKPKLIPDKSQPSVRTNLSKLDKYKICRFIVSYPSIIGMYCTKCSQKKVNYPGYVSGTWKAGCPVVKQ